MYSPLESDDLKKYGAIANGLNVKNALYASEAAEDTRSVRHHEKQLEAVPFAVEAFGKIREAAYLGHGEIQNVLPGCPMPVQIIVFEYIAAFGYKVHPDIYGGVIRWYPDREQISESYVR
ncbi:hypothetical protein [Caballeronia sordidicola]|uniref:hypothetical protein n=1 Tax=Caballeronia sordidicola TaxID=196367 RepID=UPI000A3C0347|nr:hypothetical protein [Caballeronia sordidicola]